MDPIDWDLFLLALYIQRRIALHQPGNPITQPENFSLLTDLEKDFWTLNKEPDNGVVTSTGPEGDELYMYPTSHDQIDRKVITSLFNLVTYKELK